MYAEYEDFFFKRLTQLRIQKGVSARGMSLDLGYSNGYITKIETRKSFPSLQVFFYICDYFKITPQQFFDDANPYPKELDNLVHKMKGLTQEQLFILEKIVNEMTR